MDALPPTGPSGLNSTPSPAAGSKLGPDPSSPPPNTVTSSTAAAAMAAPPSPAFAHLDAEAIGNICQALGITKKVFNEVAVALRAVKPDELLLEIDTTGWQGMLATFLPATIFIALQNLIFPAKHLPKLERVKEGLTAYLDVAKQIALLQPESAKQILKEELLAIQTAFAAEPNQSGTGVEGSPFSPLENLIHKRILELDTKIIENPKFLVQSALLRAWISRKDQGLPVYGLNPEKLRTDIERLSTEVKSKTFGERRLTRLTKIAALNILATLQIQSEKKPAKVSGTIVSPWVNFNRVTGLVRHLDQIVEKRNFLMEIALKLRTQLAKFAGEDSVKGAIDEAKTAVMDGAKTLIGKRAALEKEMSTALQGFLEISTDKVLGAVAPLTAAVGGREGINKVLTGVANDFVQGLSTKGQTFLKALTAGLKAKTA